MRALIRFRFAYVCTLHAPVLVPLMETLSGRLDPAIGMLALGLASLTMVFMDVPAGLYADRAGPRAAVRLGLLLLSGVMVGFFALGLCRAWVMAQGEAQGAWWPGVAGLCLLEIAMGVGLSLINGADTALFLGVARRSAIVGLGGDGFEGIGSSIRYLGSMVAVTMGALLYDISSYLVPGAAGRVACQSGLFLLTLVAQLVALQALSQVEDVSEGRAAARPGAREVGRGLLRLARWPALLGGLWLLCLTAATALFSSYLFQSPLNRLARSLMSRSAAWLPLYATVSMLGYFACSYGARAFQRYRAAAIRDERRADELLIHGLAGAALLLLVVYPLLALLGAGQGWGETLLLLGAIASFVLFGLLRGFADPLSTTAILRYAERERLAVPVSIVSSFSTLKRAVHFVLSAAFFAGYLGVAPSGSSEGALAETLLRLCFLLGAGMLLGIVPGLFFARPETRASEVPVLRQGKRAATLHPGKGVRAAKRGQRARAAAPPAG